MERTLISTSTSGTALPGHRWLQDGVFNFDRKVSLQWHYGLLPLSRRELRGHRRLHDGFIQKTGCFKIDGAVQLPSSEEEEEHQ